MPEVGQPASPKVSVILLTYNHEQFIRQALAGVTMQQTREPFEIIVTEDCSTDGTGAIVEAAAEEDAGRIRLVRSPTNLNTNAVTTRAIAMASGEYLAFLDGDDYWTSPEKLQKQVDYLDRHPECSMCFHDVSTVDGSGAERSPSLRRTQPAPAISGYRDIALSNFVPGPAPMIRRDVVAAMPGWFEHAPYGDWPLYLEAAKRGAIGAMDEVLGAYRIHAGGYWSGMDMDERVRQVIGFLRFLEEVESPPYRRAISHGVVHMSAYLLVNQLRGRRLLPTATAIMEMMSDAVFRGRLMRPWQILHRAWRQIKNG